MSFMTKTEILKSLYSLFSQLQLISCTTHGWLTHPDHGLYERRLSFILIVDHVDIRPVGERLGHDGQVSGFGGFVEQRSRVEVPDVLRVRRLGLRLQLSFATRVLRHLALWRRRRKHAFHTRVSHGIFKEEASAAHSSSGLTLCDAVHHGAKHQDVRAAICAASQPAVAAEACRTKRRQNTDTLVTAAVFWLETTARCATKKSTKSCFANKGKTDSGSSIWSWSGFHVKSEKVPVVESLTSRSRSCVKVGEERVQLVRTEEGVSSEFSSCCEGNTEEVFFILWCIAGTSSAITV